MRKHFEVYVKEQGTPSATFDMVVHGEGRGKFNIRLVKIDKSKAPVYSITSAATSLTKYQEFLESIPKPLEDIFNLGSTGMSFYEGEITVQFPENFSQSMSDEELQDVAALAVDGMPDLAERYLDYNDELPVVRSRISSGLLAMSMVIAISLLSLIYSGSIIPIEWLHFVGLLFCAQLVLTLLLMAFVPVIREINKIILFSLIGASSILLMLLTGFASLKLYPDRIVSKEGVIEYMFAGQRMDHLMRIRLVEDRNSSYLIPKHLLTRQPEYLPRAAIFQIREGLFGTRYIESVGLF